MSLGNFYSEVQQKKVFFTHNFDVTIEGMDGEFGGDNFKFHAMSSALPAKTINVANVSRFGITFRIPGVVTYPESWNIVVRCDENLGIHKTCNKWCDNYSNIGTNGGAVEHGTLPGSNAYVDLYDLETKSVPLDSIVIRGVFPTNVAEISVNHEDNNTIATFGMTLAMQYWFYKSQGDPL